MVFALTFVSRDAVAVAVIRLFGGIETAGEDLNRVT